MWSGADEHIGRYSLAGDAPLTHPQPPITGTTHTMGQQKSGQVYQHVYDNYWGAGQSVYAVVG
jgi:hypothetical protein